MTLGPSNQCISSLNCVSKDYPLWWLVLNFAFKLFPGDTLFLGGCGRFFEGTAAQMYNALINILSQLPEETKVYCGHEYTLQNLKFAAFVEPYNEFISKKMKWSMEQREKGLPTVRTEL